MANYHLEPPLPNSARIVVGDAGGRKRDLALLGEILETGRLRTAWLDMTGEQVVAIVGKRGTGKSYTLGVLIEALASGAGITDIAEIQGPRAGLVFDIMDIFWSSTIPLSSKGPTELQRQYAVLKETKLKPRGLAVTVWLPDGFQNPVLDPPGVNPLRISAHDLDLDDYASLFDVDIYTEPRGMLIADLIQLVSREGYATTSGEDVSQNTYYRFVDLLNCLNDCATITVNYQDQTIKSVRQRLTTYSGMPCFQGPSTPLSVLLQQFSVSVLMLARVPDALKSVLTAVLLRRIMRERRDASLARKRLDLEANMTENERTKLVGEIAARIPRSWVFLDEAHVLASAGEASVAREVLVRFAKEGRNFGLSLAVATQQPGILDTRLMSQAETLIVHQLTAPKDAEVAAQNIRSPLPTRIQIDDQEATIQTLLRQLKPGTAILSSANGPELPRLCVVQIRPRITAHGGYEA